MQYRRGVIVIQTLIGLIVVAVVLPLLTNLIQKPQDTRNRAVEPVMITTATGECCSSNWGCRAYKCDSPAGAPEYYDSCACGPKYGAGGGDDKYCKESCLGYGTCKSVGDKCCTDDISKEAYCENKLFCDTISSKSSTFGKCVEAPVCPAGMGTDESCGITPGKEGGACRDSVTPCESGLECSKDTGKCGKPVSCYRCSSNFGCKGVDYWAVGSCTYEVGVGVTKYASPIEGKFLSRPTDCKCPRIENAEKLGGDNDTCDTACEVVKKDPCKDAKGDDVAWGAKGCPTKTSYGWCGNDSKWGDVNPCGSGEECVGGGCIKIACGKYNLACCTTGTECESGYACGSDKFCHTVHYECNKDDKSSSCGPIIDLDNKNPSKCNEATSRCWGYGSTCDYNCTCNKVDSACCLAGDMKSYFCQNGLDCISGKCKEKVVCGNETQKCCTGDKKCNTTDLACNKEGTCEKCGLENQICCKDSQCKTTDLACNTTKNICEKKVEVTYWTHGGTADCNTNTGKWTCTKSPGNAVTSWKSQEACETETTNKCLVSYVRTSCDDTIGKWKCELSKTGTYTDELDATAKNKCETPVTTDKDKCEKKVECGAKDQNCCVDADKKLTCDTGLECDKDFAYPGLCKVPKACGDKGQKCCTTGDKCKTESKLTCASIKGLGGLPVDICVSMSNCIYNKGSTYTGPNAIGGDYDCDGVVNIADYSVWRKEKIDATYWKGTAWWSDGAIEYGVLDGSDYSLWRHKFLD